jgi:hypothetical protein
MSSSFAADVRVRYPEGASQSAIAADQAAKASMSDQWCLLIDTRTGRCTQTQILWAGGGDGGSASGGAGASAGASAGSSGGTGGNCK